jgi:hypothetical protein
MGEEAFRESIPRSIVCPRSARRIIPLCRLRGSENHEVSHEKTRCYRLFMMNLPRLGHPRSIASGSLHGRKSGPPLVALWIDDQMRAFEQDCIPEVPLEPRELWDEQVR